VIRGEDDATTSACLVLAGDDANVPVYQSGNPPNFDAACAADPAKYTAGAAYRVGLFGGELFDDTVLSDLHTPNALEISSPDASTFDLPVMLDEDLEVTWTGEPANGSRLVVRLWDDSGYMFTVRATDDGAFTIPASALASLVPGPATLTVAREIVDDREIGDGVIRVVTRYEAWAYLDLQ
jgi:hypothetical protein